MYLRPCSLGQLILKCLKLLTHNYQRVKNQIAFHYADRRTDIVKSEIAMHSYGALTKSLLLTLRASLLIAYYSEL